MTVPEEVVECPLDIDKSDRVLLCDLAADAAVFVHSRPHSVLAAGLHDVRGHEENALTAFLCRNHHFLDVCGIVIGRDCALRICGHIKLTPDVVYADADADPHRRTAEYVPVPPCKQVARGVPAYPGVQYGYNAFRIPCGKHIVDDPDIAASEVFGKLVADRRGTSHIGDRVAGKYYSVSVFEYHVFFLSVNNSVLPKLRLMP